MMADQAPGLALIIGGGNGIGEATALLMRSRGWTLAIADRDGENAERVARSVEGEAFTLDIADVAAIDLVAGRIGAVDALVVAAAVFQDIMPPEDYPMDTWERDVRINLTGTYATNRAFGTLMAKRGRGSIVNIASIAALGSMPVYSYGTTKAAVVSLTKNLAGEWGRSGVRVNCISPGSTLVPRVRARLESGRYAADPGEFTALGRMVESNEVAEAIEFLASRRASAITGVNLVVDAGWHVAQTWAQFGGVRKAVPRED
jgi:NAD(P)-dependent dehydrogenase (short-subunit alcohol dehydrogenase family)